MARSPSYERAISPAELYAIRRQGERDSRLRVVEGLRGAVRLIRTDEKPAEAFHVNTEKSPSAPYDWADDPTIARTADSHDRRLLDAATDVGANVLLFLIAPDDSLPKPQS